MRMVEMPVDQVVNVIAVGNLLMPAVGAADVSLIVPTAVMIGRAAVRIRDIDFQHVIFNLIAAHVLQMPILEVVGLNNKAKVTMRKAYGYRTFRIAELSLYHVLGKLPEPKLAHKFF
jgi:hypothetical protein